MIKFLKKIFPTKHERDIKKLMPLVAKINELDEKYKSLSDDKLISKTDEFKDRIANGESLDSILCEAFATVKNACRRLYGTTVKVCGHEWKWEMIPFDVQLIGGIVLHQGKIAEMATGEGKTLVATMPLYLNALTGRNVHLATHNDYLARRDAQWMGHLFNFLGITVGCIQAQTSFRERKQEYLKDITYGSSTEFGFDYLRDHCIVYEPEMLVQNGHYYAIVDEVDSLLIDEARTPLIISGPSQHSSSEIYRELKPKVEKLYRQQRMLCTELIEKAKKAVENGDLNKAGIYLYQVKHGMPKHKQLLHMMEDPVIRKLVEDTDLKMLSDAYKEQSRQLREELYFTVDEKSHEATLTEKGCQAISPEDPEAYILPDLVTEITQIDSSSLTEAEKIAARKEAQERFMKKSERIHAVDQLIRAYCLFEKDVDYVVQNNQVLIVDEFTGRILPGRRWSDGLHQAIEAKEDAIIEHETQTIASITIQNYFRMYEKLAGMTGTAITEAEEFRQIYNLDVVVIPTHRPVRRIDYDDLIYKTKREKYKAIIEEIKECYARGQPVLVGTISVEVSEILSRMLRMEKIPHNVLNAKNHEKEAEIIAMAGQKGAVTIATNMAGRGTDIKLVPEVVKLEREIIESDLKLSDYYKDGLTLREYLIRNPCGLHVIGTERHEARRIDRQLRGRCARQGDPGSSRFYISLEDDLMRLFGSDRIAKIMTKLGLEEGEPLQHPFLNRSIETAQKRVEQHNFAIRKRTLEYDDVLNKQREIIYSFRDKILRSQNPREEIYNIIHDLILTKTEEINTEENKELAISQYIQWLQSTFPIAINSNEIAQHVNSTDDMVNFIFKQVKQAYEIKCSFEDPKVLPYIERYIVLKAIDESWQEYLRHLDALREGIGLRAYGQRDPLVEYKKEAFEMFGSLMDQIKEEVASTIFRITSTFSYQTTPLIIQQSKTIHHELSTFGAGINNIQIDGINNGTMNQHDNKPVNLPVQRQYPKVGRNDPCPCGSGKKYKKCCGR